jgi:endonuclease YncB( thermonuclease family)
MAQRLHPFSVILLPIILALWTPAISYAQPARALPPGDDAKVTRVVSGDTIEVTIKGIGFTIGYLGVDAPDPATAKAKAECYGAQAAAFNRNLVAGMTVRVERDVSDFEPSGRLLRYVYLPDGRMVNEELAKGGYARVTSNTPDRRYQDRLNAAQTAAQAAKRGLWGACANAAQATATPAPAAPHSGSCVVIDYATLDVRGPRPAVLDGLPDGACVTLIVEGQSSKYGWHPAGSRIHMDRSMFVRWQDAMVPIERYPDGKFLAQTCTGGIRFWPGPGGGLLIHEDPKDWAMKEVERGGSRGEIVMLPGSKTFVFEDLGNGEFRALVDTLQLIEGTFVKRALTKQDYAGKC